MKIKNGWIITLVLLLGYFSVTSMMEHQARQADHNHDQLQCLRKISDKLCTLEQRFDDTPFEDKLFDRVRESGDEAEFLINCTLRQFRFFKTGNVRTGLTALFIPDFFLNDEERAFDECNDEILSYYNRVHYYMAAMNSVLKDTLIDRNSRIIERRAEWVIERNLSAIIEQAIAQEIFSRGDFRTPCNINREVRRYYKRGSISGKELEQKLFDKILTNIDHFDFRVVKKMIIEQSMPRCKDTSFEIVRWGPEEKPKERRNASNETPGIC